MSTLEVEMINIVLSDSTSIKCTESCLVLFLHIATSTQAIQQHLLTVCCIHTVFKSCLEATEKNSCTPTQTHT